MLAMVRNVRRLLRQQFFRTKGRNRNMRIFLVYEFLRPSVPQVSCRSGLLLITVLFRWAHNYRQSLLVPLDSLHYQLSADKLVVDEDGLELFSNSRQSVPLDY